VGDLALQQIPEHFWLETGIVGVDGKCFSIINQDRAKAAYRLGIIGAVAIEVEGPATSSCVLIDSQRLQLPITESMPDLASGVLAEFNVEYPPSDSNSFSPGRKAYVATATSPEAAAKKSNVKDGNLFVSYAVGSDYHVYRANQSQAPVFILAHSDESAIRIFEQHFDRLIGTGRVDRIDAPGFIFDQCIRPGIGKTFSFDMAKFAENPQPPHALTAIFTPKEAACTTSQPDAELSKKQE
jgi:hypothetical protein